MATLDIRATPYDMKIDRIKFDKSKDFIEWGYNAVYLSSNVNGVISLARWADFDNLIMALKKAKELHELQQKGGEK